MERNLTQDAVVCVADALYVLEATAPALTGQLVGLLSLLQVMCRLLNLLVKR